MSSTHLQVALTSVSNNARGNRGVSRSGGNVLALEVGEEGGVVLGESAGGAEAVDDTVTAKVGGADFTSGGGGDGEGLALVGLKDSVDVLENVALSQDVATLTDLESVAGVVVPVVVDLSS